MTAGKEGAKRPSIVIGEAPKGGKSDIVIGESPTSKSELIVIKIESGSHQGK